MFRFEREVSPEQIEMWMAFDELEPLGPKRDRDMLALHGANLSIACGIPIELSKFDPWDETAPDSDEPMSDEELQANLERLTC